MVANMEIVKKRSGESISTIAQMNESAIERWMHIPIQPLTLEERQTIVKNQLASGGSLNSELVYLTQFTVSGCILIILFRRKK